MDRFNILFITSCCFILLLIVGIVSLMIYVRIKDVNEQNDIGTELAQHHLSYSIAVIHREDEVNSRVFRAEKAWQDNDYIYADNISVLIMYFDGMRELPITYGVQKFNRSQYYLQ